MGVISVQGLVPGWDEISVPEVLTGRLGVPVVVDNDANLGALAESRFGASRGDRDLIFVRASYGVGAGIILGGELHRGFAGTAGEIGHVQVDPQGQICRCGSRGCLNTVVGAQSLTESLRTSRGVVTLRDIVQLARDRDPGCRRLVADAGAAIGAVVAAMAVAINPQSIVVGGELAETGEVLLDPIREAVNHGALPNRVAPIEVMASALGPRAELRGAIALALEHGERPSLAVESERGLRLLDGAGQTLAAPGYPLEREAGES
jgi:predicted NBD/HSP70 family sugar kinase